MSAIARCPLPENALLNFYAADRGCYTDCYATDIAGSIELADYVVAFYTSALFKLERLILRIAISKPSTDAEARLLACGDIDHFAAWTVERRTPDQLLMCDLAGRTRSWFMVVGGAETSRLYFGSAVVPAADGGSRSGPSDFMFKVLLGFHKLYSRALLWSAKRGLSPGQ